MKLETVGSFVVKYFMGVLVIAIVGGMMTFYCPFTYQCEGYATTGLGSNAVIIPPLITFNIIDENSAWYRLGMWLLPMQGGCLFIAIPFALMLKEDIFE